jgi:hypothetical protein
MRDAQTIVDMETFEKIQVPEGEMIVQEWPKEGWSVCGERAAT